MTNNIPAVLTMIKYIYDNISYADSIQNLTIIMNADLMVKSKVNDDNHWNALVVIQTVIN